MSRINLSAGQTMLSPACRAALGRQMDTPIYYPDYYQAELETAVMLQRLMGTQSEVLILTGNATHAIEACLLSLLEPREAFLAINSGLFGQVFLEVGQAIGVTPIEFRVPLGKTITPKQLDRTLKASPNLKAVSLVHVETSTGVLAPLEDLAQVVRNNGRLLIVDAVSSLGAMPLQMDAWGVDIIISSGQKALNAPQGLAIVALSGHAWEIYETRKSPVPSICLDLGVWRSYRRNGVEAMMKAWQGQTVQQNLPAKIVHGPSPSGSLVFGLRGALEDIFTEGLDRVFLRHLIASRAVREGLRALNLNLLADEELSAPSVTTAQLPNSISELELRKVVYTEFGVALGAGPVEIGLNAIRLGTMGRAAHPRLVLPGLAALGSGLRRFGHECSPKAGSVTAKAVFDQEGLPGLWEINYGEFLDQ
jgi:aspartate aminotransferase-like enzyme